MDSVKPNIILLGPQGSGKSTQSDILVKHYGYILFSAGNIIRNRARKKDQTGKKVLNSINSGKLIDVNILFDEIFEPFLKKIRNKPIIFDGIPRNITQLNKFNHILKKLKIESPYLIHISINKSTAFKRISTRLICPSCNQIFKPEDTGYDEKICPNDNIKLISRKDDTNKKALDQRFNTYITETKKIIPYYKKNKKYYKIDGSKNIEQVSELIKKTIKKIA